MLCQKCKKNEANVHFKQIINGDSTEMFLCDSCANEEQVFGNFESNMGNFLSGMFSDPFFGTSKQQQLKKPISCDKCSMTYDEFTKSGKFGCADCYNTFGAFLPAIFRGVHGNDVHKGKLPKRSGEKFAVEQKLKSLKDELAKAISLQEFERAATLRDEIKNLEGGLS